MSRIWFRYFFKEICKVFFLVIFSVYFLYTLIDYSAHSKAFQGAAFNEILLYYAYQFARKADILMTLAILLSTIKVLITFNVKNEIVAMAASGLSLKKLLNPFLFAAFLSAFSIYLNFQYIQPLAFRKIETFEDTYFDKVKEDYKKRAHAAALADNTLLLYQRFDSGKRAFFDTYWIKNPDEIYKIQTLFPYEVVPIGENVDILVRSPDGDLIRQSTHNLLKLEKFSFQKKGALAEIYPPSWQSFSGLASNFSFLDALFNRKNMSDREAESAANFFYKLFIPLTSFLAVLGPAAFCLQFSRNLRVFFVFALSLFGVFAFFTLSNSCLILGESQVTSPFWPFFSLFCLAFLVCGGKYAKL